MKEANSYKSTGEQQQQSFLKFLLFFFLFLYLNKNCSRIAYFLKGHFTLRITRKNTTIVEVVYHIVSDTFVYVSFHYTSFFSIEIMLSDITLFLFFVLFFLVN